MLRNLEGNFMQLIPTVTADDSDWVPDFAAV
jgi:hypothetical protein